MIDNAVCMEKYKFDVQSTCLGSMIRSTLIYQSGNLNVFGSALDYDIECYCSTLIRGNIDIRGVMIKALDPDSESDFLPFADSGSGL